MEFRLVYRGPLKSDTSATAEDKQRIRQALHYQLERVWQVQHPMRGIYESKEKLLEQLAAGFNVAGTNFLPLVNTKFGNICSLEVTILWRSKGRGVLQAPADIDNRIKTLIDALRRPGNQFEIGPSAPTPDSRGVFYCLFEDDSLVTELTAIADRLHEPPGEDVGGHPETHVIAVILVKTKRGNEADYWPAFC